MSRSVAFRIRGRRQRNESSEMRKRTGADEGGDGGFERPVNKNKSCNMSDVATKREGDTAEAKESQLNAKRAKCDDTGGRGDHSDGEPACKSNILSGFVTSQILNDSAREKKIFVHGKVRDRLI